MHILLIFVDGIGLGANDPNSNPFSVAAMPTLTALTNDNRWLAGIGQQISTRATFQPADPRMGITGRPQSGTGHATIITGKNIPALIGKHYGPKPNAETREIVAQGTFFTEVQQAGKTASLLTAYPPFLLHNIARGKTLPSSFQQAAMHTGQTLFTVDDLRAGNAISADWTGAGWQRDLSINNVPVLSPQEGGKRMVQLSRQHDFAMVSYVFTDYVGHRGTVADGTRLLQNLDAVMEGAMAEWDDDEGLMLLVSDHGNMEDVSIRQHTENDVPLLVIGKESYRTSFVEGIRNLADIVPAMRRLLLP